MKVQAKRVAGFDECKGPGDFFLTPPNAVEGGARRLSFLCPCGCGMLCGIKVRDDGQQVDGAWAWDRNEEQPTTMPSIRIGNGDSSDHWHGYFTKGEFVSC